MSPHLATSLRTLAATAVFFTTMQTMASAGPLDVQLNFGSLPSAQGWTYAPIGAHSGVPEAAVFSVSVGILSQNSTGQSNGVSGGSILYYLTPGVTNTESKQMRVAARCLSVEPSGTATLGQGGFFFGFNARFPGGALEPDPVR